MREKENETGREKSSDDATFKEAIEGEAEVIHENSGRQGGRRLPLALAGLALVLVTAGLLFGYRYWLQMEQTLSRLDTALQQANQEQATLVERLQQAQREAKQQLQATAEQELALKEQHQQLLAAKQESKRTDDQLYHALSEIQARLGGKEAQWRVAEAEYLLRVANHRLNLMADPGTAMEALKAADERLSATGDPGWSRVRDQIAREITLLTALPKVDQAGISAELAALADQLGQLPLLHEGVSLVGEIAPPEETESVVEKGVFDLSQITDDLWQGLKSMLVIRHHEKPVSAMLPPEQRYFLLQNMRLKLEAAKAALMGRNQPLYEDNLKVAAAWVGTYFDVEDPGVSGFRQQLEGLARRNVAPELPDISSSLRSLRTRRQRLSQELIQ
jgi:uroporphyrin-3 C-methyltransferase